MKWLILCIAAAAVILVACQPSSQATGSGSSPTPPSARASAQTEARQFLVKFEPHTNRLVDASKALEQLAKSPLPQEPSWRDAMRTQAQLVYEETQQAKVLKWPVAFGESSETYLKAMEQYAAGALLLMDWVDGGSLDSWVSADLRAGSHFGEAGKYYALMLYQLERQVDQLKSGR